MCTTLGVSNKKNSTSISDLKTRATGVTVECSQFMSSTFFFHLILKDSTQDTAVFVIEIAVQISSVVVDLLFRLFDLGPVYREVGDPR